LAFGKTRNNRELDWRVVNFAKKVNKGICAAFSFSTSNTELF
jgi:hypothetical protein